MSPLLWNELYIALVDTCYMVGISTLLASILGLPLGILLFSTAPWGLSPHHLYANILGGIVNITRSIPFVILMIALIPVTHWLIGSSIGTSATIVPLTIGAMPFVARLVANALADVSSELILMARSLGANNWQIIWHVLLPEARTPIIKGIVLTMIAVVGYSAMAGTLGGGGLGDLAVRYGYQRFDYSVMLLTVIILILMVQIIQWLGDYLVRLCDHRVQLSSCTDRQTV